MSNSTSKIMRSLAASGSRELNESVPVIDMDKEVVLHPTPAMRPDKESVLRQCFSSGHNKSAQITD